jgi:hypothetical protein
VRTWESVYVRKTRACVCACVCVCVCVCEKNRRSVLSECDDPKVREE